MTKKLLTAVLGLAFFVAPLMTTSYANWDCKPYAGGYADMDGWCGGGCNIYPTLASCCTAHPWNPSCTY